MGYRENSQELDGRWLMNWNDKSLVIEEYSLIFICDIIGL